MSWKKHRSSREDFDPWQPSTTHDGQLSAKPLQGNPSLTEPLPEVLHNDQENCAPSIKLNLNLARHQQTLKSTLLASTQRRDRATNFIRNENYYGGTTTDYAGDDFPQLSQKSDQPVVGFEQKTSSKDLQSKRQPLLEIVQEAEKATDLKTQTREFKKKRVRRDVFQLKESEQATDQNQQKDPFDQVSSQIPALMVQNQQQFQPVCQVTTTISEEEKRPREQPQRQETANQRAPSEQIRPIWVPEITNPKLTDFMMNPLPEQGTIRFYIKRVKNSFKTYYHLISQNLRTVLYAQPQSGTIGCNYHIALTKDTAKVSEGYLGKLRGNFMGSTYMLYSKGDKPAKQFKETDRLTLANVQYEMNILGMKGPRRINIRIPKPGADLKMFKTAESQNLEKVQQIHKDSTMLFKNRTPKWNSQLNSYALNFGGKVKMASIKNFMLEDPRESTKNCFVFGKIDDSTFNLELSWPFSPYQAFAIALTSFDSKLNCQ